MTHNAILLSGNVPGVLFPLSRQLADRLGIPLYEEDLLKEAARRGLFSQKDLHCLKEASSNSLLYRLYINRLPGEKPAAPHGRRQAGVLETMGRLLADHPCIFSCPAFSGPSPCLPGLFHVLLYSRENKRQDRLPLPPVGTPSLMLAADALGVAGCMRLILAAAMEE